MSTREPVATLGAFRHGTGGTALFVDDEQYVLDGVRAALRTRGFRILTAVGADEGLALLERERINVVVSDQKMPKMSGTAFLAEVRRRHPRVIRMVLSGSTEPETIARAVNEAGVFRYLLKPCTPEDMGLAVEQALEAYAAHDGRQVPHAGSVSIDSAIANIAIALQPIYGSHSGELCAHEALLRQTGGESVDVGTLLDSALGAGRLWELERAIRAHIASRLPGRPAGTAVFVNLHPNSLLDPQLFTARDPLAPFASAVVLEVTERGSLDEIGDLRERIARLRMLGYRIAVDDMGSGYSGLTTFTAVLPDYVKFDRELIASMHKTPSKQKLVRSITAVCHELKIMTIAEGIEEAADLRAARDIGCSMLQGYALARPGLEFCSESCDLNR